MLSIHKSIPEIICASRHRSVNRFSIILHLLRNHFRSMCLYDQALMIGLLKLNLKNLSNEEI
ncbi:hypothetical protein BSR55_05570 [Acinetobacter bereziniae]|nr:hypothetical protein BSR55_05570 [Acinetobacter bereziniae]